jgi:hypothetical protein
MKTAILLSLMIVAPLTGNAQDIKPIDIKTGLWETTSTSEMTGMPATQMPQIPADKLAQLSPEQQARIQSAMKGRGGPQTSTIKSCFTQEQLNKGLNLQNDNSCTYKVTSSSGSRQEIHTECTRGQMKTTGDLTLDRIDSEHVKGTMVMKGLGSTPQTNNVNMKVSFETKFISSNCGDVKPAGTGK